jgi:hypothetical protein
MSREEHNSPMFCLWTAANKGDFANALSRLLRLLKACQSHFA